MYTRIPSAERARAARVPFGRGGAAVVIVVLLDLGLSDGLSLADGRQGGRGAARAPRLPPRRRRVPVRRGPLRGGRAGLAVGGGATGGRHPGHGAGAAAAARATEIERVCMCCTTVMCTTNKCET